MQAKLSFSKNKLSKQPMIEKSESSSSRKRTKKSYRESLEASSNEKNSCFSSAMITERRHEISRSS